MGNKFFMSASFGNTAVRNDKNLVRIFNRRKTVRNCNNCFTVCKFSDSLLN